MRSERVPEGPKMTPKTLLGPFGPILAYFGGGRPEIFLSPFGPKKAKIFFSKKNLNLHYFDSQRVWDPQKPKIDPIDPRVDPILAQFVGKKADFGVKIRVFLKYVFSSKMTFSGVLGSVFIGFQVVLVPPKR